jgi:PAP2 superfamily protein
MDDDGTGDHSTGVGDFRNRAFILQQACLEGSGPGFVRGPRMVRAAIVCACLFGLCQPVAAQSDPASGSRSQPAAQVSRDETSLGSIFRELGGDFRDLPSLETAAILGVGGALSLAVHTEDVQVTQRFSSSPGLELLLEPGEAAGDGVVQVGLALGVYAFGRGTHSHRVSLLGADLLRGQIMNTTLTQGIKLATNRARPDGSRYSFPSGHTSLAVTTATVFQRHLGWRVGIPSYGLALWVGGSRMQENKHYLSDVIFGAAIGLVSGRTATIGRGKATFVVTPVGVARGGGISLTLLNRS